MNSYTPTPRSPNVTPTGAEARERAAEFESSAPMTPTATTALDDRPSRDDVTYNSTMPSPGRRIGRYLVIEQIGAGGMGVVFSAYDDVLDRRVALKLVLDRRRGDATWYARTLREAQALARLSHPNVVQIYEAGEYADEIYLAMEFIKGCTLRELLKQRARARGGGPPRRDELPAILDLFQQAGHGLAAAHGSGLVHRDFKPANVLVDEAGRARVADFGLVAATATATTEATQGGDDTRQRHRADALGIELTREGAVMGTLAYMSPEQLSGQSADAQSDQFSFCVALHEALHGARPFAGEDYASLRANVPLGIRAAAPANRAVPAWVQAVIERGLRAEPRERWPSMTALLDALARDPTRRRRRWLAAALVTLVGAGGLFSYTLYERRRSDACAEQAREATKPWTDNRAGVRAGLLATKLPYAATTAARVEALLDRWTDAWIPARVDVCLHPEDDGRDAVRSTCLDRQVTDLASLVPLLVGADPPIVQRAVAAAASLPRVALCDDPRWLATERVAVASDAARSIGQQLATARSFELMGASARGHAVTTRVIEEARALGDERLLAEALLLHGTLQRSIGAPAEARLSLLDAYYRAGELGHHRVAAEAAVELIDVIGYQQARAEEGLEWGRHAAMWIGYLGLRDEAIGAAYHNHLGELLIQSGPTSAPEALEHLERALEILVATLGPAHPDVAGAHNNIGMILSNLGDDEAALQHCERALEIVERALGPEHPDVATALTNIGAIALGRGDLTAARELFERALALRSAAFGPEHLEVANAHGNLGAALRALGEHDRALEQFKRSLAIREAALGPQHPDVALSLQSVGATLFARGDPAAALPWFQRALAVRAALHGDEHPDTAETYLSLGAALIDLGRADEAVAALLAGLRGYEATLGRKHPALIEGLTSLAAAYSATGQEEAAIAALERARSIERRAAP